MALEVLQADESLERVVARGRLIGTRPLLPGPHRGKQLLGDRLDGDRADRDESDQRVAAAARRDARATCLQLAPELARQSNRERRLVAQEQLELGVAELQQLAVATRADRGGPRRARDQPELAEDGPAANRQDVLV